MKFLIAEHPAMARDLRNLATTYEYAGAQVIRQPVPTTDSVFLRDSFAWTPFGLIGCIMGKTSRCTEPERLSLPTVFTIPEGTFEGADLLWLREGSGYMRHRYRAIVANGQRTNVAGADALAKWLRAKGVEVFRVTLPEWHDQHLLGVANAIGGWFFALDGLFPELEPIPLPVAEYKDKGPNWVQVGKYVVLNEACPETIRIVAQHADPVPIPITQLLAHGGGPACATGILEP